MDRSKSSLSISNQQKDVHVMEESSSSTMGKDDFRTRITNAYSDNNQRSQSSSSLSPVSTFLAERIGPVLDRRRRIGSLRRLQPFHRPGTIDFSSNDYLGLAQNRDQQRQVDLAYQQLSRHMLGSTGSRLLTGDSDYTHELENRLAQLHNRPAALLCNSGYDANLSVLSALTLDSIVVMDELCHNSIQMGLRLSKDCTIKSFLHNNQHDLERILNSLRASRKTKPVLIVVESVYSMDGDQAPLRDILDIALVYHACVIVDEAHGLGVFGENGMGVLEEYGLERHPALLCTVYTFGKAAGCHGAVVCGPVEVKEYLYNYGRPIVYSTSLPLHSLVTISCAYHSMSGKLGSLLRFHVFRNIEFFRRQMDNVMGRADDSIALVPSSTPIQALIIPGNSKCVDFCDHLTRKSGNRIRLYPIRSPTVPKGQERVRIVIHSHNTKDELEELISLIKWTLEMMGYLTMVSGCARRSRL